MLTAVALERPREAPIYTDEALEFWGGVYLANPALRARGVTFEAFLAEPELLLEQRLERSRLALETLIAELQ